MPKMTKLKSSPDIDPEEVERLVQEQRAKERAEKAKSSPPKGKLRKRDYVKKGVYYGLFYPVIWPWLRYKSLKKNLKISSDQYRGYMHGLKEKRDPWAKNAPDMSNFRQVLKHWSIRNQKELNQCISGMQNQMIFFVLIGLWGLYLLTGSLLAQLHAIPLIFVSLVMVITKFWRIQVLTRKRFVYFKDWFLWGMFAWIGQETPFAREKRLKKERQYE